MTLKFAIAAGLLLGFATASAAQCPVSEIEKALTAPLQDLSLSEHPVEDIQSTEGGVWRV